MTWPGSDEDVATNTVGKPLAHIEMRIADEQGKFELSVCIMHTRYAIFGLKMNSKRKHFGTGRNWRSQCSRIYSLPWLCKGIVTIHCYDLPDFRTLKKLQKISMMMDGGEPVILVRFEKMDVCQLREDPKI